MAGSEPLPEQDEPPTAVSEKIANHDKTTVDEVKIQAELKERREEIDDFGLPVKRIAHCPIRESTVSEDEDSQDEEEHFENAPETRTESPPIEDLSPDIETGKQLDEDGTVSMNPPGHHQSSYTSQTVCKDSSRRNKGGSPSSSRLGDKEAEIKLPPPPSQISDDYGAIAAPSVVDNLLHGGATGGASGWSHQALAPHKPEETVGREEKWQDMPAFAPYDLYDDDGKLIAKEARDSDDEGDAYTGLGGAGKGYTKVQLDEDARSATSMDDNTDYLFKPKGTDLADEDEDQRDPLAQLQATKNLLTEGQRIAYVGVTRLALAEMVKELDGIERTKNTKKGLTVAVESMKMWSQLMMVRLYMHMEINSSEQVMIEQLAEHGVEPADLTPALMQNARVKNPMADEASLDRESLSSPNLNGGKRASNASQSQSCSEEAVETQSLPPYKEHEDGEMPEVRTPSQLGTSKNIDIDIRWTVLCDLFLVLLADSIYDSRSRTLLERVGKSMDVSWLEICRFEKRVTDSLEMQEAANKETWDEAAHMETRRKLALKRRYMVMGLATVGGSLVIGLSAGLMAPIIGAGLAAGFTTIGVAGTGGFLAGAGGTALIASGAVVTGGTIAVRASNRRMGAVQTFEYRPLYNNKRVNLIVTISGWMNGKVDDVRLPFSTVDPVMGDMYSVLWEPEMLQSMGDTINILATEALTQGLQQVLGSTILVALMASLQLPIVLTKLSYLIDNPWTVSMGRANAAGLILADSLIDRNLGVRPITLVGFSLGARVIFSCLRELANRGAFGLIQNVYLFGSPIVANKDEYLRVRTVVSGRFVNGYASNDWILGYLFRATSGGIMRVAGLAPLEGVHGLENIDVTKLVNGHMAYRAAMPKLLREVGWEVESDEFTEIEDPDPENHEKRQRELIHEIDEARKEAEVKPGKRRFGFFKKGRLAEKKGWETYDESMGKGGDWNASPSEAGGNVLFDIEAIKAELASEQIEVRQLESTLPPMKLNLNGTSSEGSDVNKTPQGPYSSLRETKSYDATMAFRPKGEAPASHSSLTNGHKENPFNQGYDEYNISAEIVAGPAGAAHSKVPLESSLQCPSPRHSSQFPTDSSRIPSPRLSSPVREVTETAAPQRPPLRTSTTMPPSTTNLGLEHNAWAEGADEDDDDFGKEQEMQLTFG